MTEIFEEKEFRVDVPFYHTPDGSLLYNSRFKYYVVPDDVQKQRILREDRYAQLLIWSWCGIFMLITLINITVLMLGAEKFPIGLYAWAFPIAGMVLTVIFYRLVISRGLTPANVKGGGIVDKIKLEAQHLNTNVWIGIGAFFAFTGYRRITDGEIVFGIFAVASAILCFVLAWLRSKKSV